MDRDRSKPKLLWPSSTRVPYADVPRWLEESLRNSFPQLHVVIARNEETFSEEIAGCEILVSWKIQPEDFARCRKLRWIHCPATGVAQLLSPGLAESDVIVTNGRTVHAVPVAEQALALIFALARRLPACFRYQAERRWERDESWHPQRVPTEVNGKTLGLVGLGTIGRAVAVRARSLGMRVVAVKRDPSTGSDVADRVYSPQQFERVLAEADFLVLAAPDTPETRHLIGKSELERMKPTAFLINVARGSLVDSEALTQALQAGVIAGAGLDVTEPEPLPPKHSLWKLPHVLITPHLAGATDRFWERQADLLRENLCRYLSGESLLNVVDKKRGY